MPYRYPIKYGKYLLTRRIAVGGMAEVFKAKLYGPRGFEKTLAIKRILPEFGEDEDFVSMFVDEARISSKLHHGNIVQVFDFGQEEDAYYLAMEYVDGSNLKNLFRKTLKSQNLFPRHLAIYIALQVAKALEYAHQMKQDDDNNTLELVHRDISPQNILVAYDGQVKLTDFGIAKATIKLSKTQPGKVQGKLSYMSPEQAMGKSLDRRSDIFSLGIILYELISGQKVYASEDTSERYKKIRKAQIEPLKSLAPDISDYLNQTVMQLLEKEPWARPNNCTEVIQKLSESIKKYNLDELAMELAQLMQQQFPKESSTGTNPLGSAPSLLNVPGHLIEEISSQTQVRPDDLSSIDHEIEQQQRIKQKFSYREASKALFQTASIYLFEDHRKKYTFGILAILLLLSLSLSIFLPSRDSNTNLTQSDDSEDVQASRPDYDQNQNDSAQNNITPPPIVSPTEDQTSLTQLSSEQATQNEPHQHSTEQTFEELPKKEDNLELHGLKLRQQKIHNDIEMEQTIKELEDDVTQLKQENESKTEALQQALNEIERLKKTLPTTSTLSNKDCPKGMKKVPGGTFIYGSTENDPDRNSLTESIARKETVKSFCMDTYEYPNQKNQTPQVNVTWEAAQNACMQQGKRLCSVYEWEHACKTSQNNKYSFSSQQNEDACNIQKSEFESTSLQASGSREQCKNSLNIFDLSGNALEWTKDKGLYAQNTYVAKGGSMQRPLYQARCAAHLEFEQNHSETDLGFRCCKNY